MVDITDKKNTLRFASAEAIIIVSNKQTIRAIQKKIVPKGDVFEVSRAAGLLGVKKTSELYQSYGDAVDFLKGKYLQI